MNDFKNLNIAVAGTGYVGLSIATLLAQHHQVTAVDVIPEKVEKINNRISPIQDEYIEKYLAEKELNLTATLDGASAYKNADFVVIAAPTNYDPVKNYFDTSHVCPEHFEMLMFDDTCVRYFFFCIIYNSITLIVRHIQYLSFKVYSTIFQLAELIVVELINSSCKHNLVSQC